MIPNIGVTCSTRIRPDLQEGYPYALPQLYADGVDEGGGLPWMLPSGDPRHVPAYLEQIDGVLLSGGWDLDPALYGHPPHPALGAVDPARDAFEIAVARAAHAADLPILAICRGVQILNVALGGTLLQDVPSLVDGALEHDQGFDRWTELAHPIEVVPGSRLAGVVGAGRVEVNSFHHQCADALGTGLVVSARASDGVVEGLEDPGRTFCLGVQWHPERRGGDVVSRALFAALVDAARVGAAAAGR